MRHIRIIKQMRATGLLRLTNVLPGAGCLFVIVMNVWSCVKPYNANIHAPATGYLVVEGNLNTAPTPTTITLSRSVALTDTASEVYENGAAVYVEGSDGFMDSATSGGNGTYNFGALPLNSTTTYRLEIKTSDLNDYLSEYVPVIPNPPIDSVNATFDATGAQLLVNTHNPNNNTRYYMWSYVETWEYHSAEESAYMYLNDSIVYRPTSQDVYTCYRTQASTNLLIYSSAKLSQDVVSKFQLLAIPQGDQRLSVEYSLLVNQYALSDSAYDYLQLMQSNTESLGSIFDPLPSSLTGNIRCVTNPALQVVGYVNASGFQTARIFVARPEYWTYEFQCPAPDTMLPFDTFLVHNFGGGPASLFTPVSSTLPPGLGWISNYTSCVDCTSQGGTTTKPSFWP
jgi:hypothetical protein